MRRMKLTAAAGRADAANRAALTAVSEEIVFIYIYYIVYISYFIFENRHLP